MIAKTDDYLSDDQSTGNHLLDSALYCASFGLRVHPLRTSGNTKAPKFDKWQELATTDPEQIQDWWAEFPNANVGIAAGRKSNLTVLDLDGPDAVQAFLDWLKERGLDEPMVPCVETGRGGRHYYFNFTSLIENSAGKIHEKWDTRSEGGNVVAPGSIHPETKKPYRWIRTFDDCDKTDVPLALIALYREKAQAEKQKSVLEKQGKWILGEQETRMTQFIGGMVRNGATQDAIDAAALVEAEQRCDPPMLPKDALRIAHSIGKKEPEDPLFALDPTDWGRVQRFAIFARDRLRWVEERQCWAAFDGKRWKLNAGSVAQDRWFAFSEVFQTAVSLMPEDTDDELVSKELYGGFAGRTDDLTVMERGLKTARATLSMSAEEFDCQPWLFNCDNGTIDLRTGKLMPHDSAHYLTKISPTAYVPGSRSESWGGFLNLVTDGDEALKKYLQQTVGFTMCGDPNEQLLFVLYGRGATGKSTFVSIIRKIFGTYSSVASQGSFLKQAAKGGPNPTLAHAAGARLVSGVEIGQDEELDEALIKNITGNETITTRDLHQSNFSYDPQFTMWLASNDLPNVSGNSAIFRRVRVVPFKHVIPDSEQDHTYKARFLESKTDLEGVLAWAVEGCTSWLTEGIIEPAVVTNATKDYENETNPVADFVAAHCEYDEKAVFKMVDALKLWRMWAEANGVAPGKDGRKLTSALGHMGIKVDRMTIDGTQQRVYRGIRVKADTSESRDDYDFSS